MSVKARRVMKSKTKTKTPTKEKKITIPKMSLKTIQMTLVGTAPLMTQQFSSKSKRQIEEKQQKLAKPARQKRNPQAEFEAALYKIPGKKKKYGIPAMGLKLACVSACRFTEGMKMTTTIGSFHVVAPSHGLLEIDSKAGPQMDERIVRIGSFPSKVADMRYRPRFDKWSITFQLQFNDGVISAEQICNLFEIAGFSVGLGEYRCEKKGNLGSFTVKRG